MLTASHLVRRFGNRLAVDDVSFEVRSGEVFGLLGPNGAGKTTTLRMLGGLILPTSGQVVIGGALSRQASGGGTGDGGGSTALRSRIGFLTETPGLWEHLTLLDNLMVYGRLFGMPDPAVAVERALRRFDLWDRAADKAGKLSKGMKQKAALARALLHDPEIVLLDEPTANLDPQTARSVRELLLELSSRGRVVVVSTHNLDEIERLADRVALISTRLVAVGEPAVLRREMFGRRIRVRFADAGAVERFRGVVEGAGASDIRMDEGALTMAVGDADQSTPAIVRALVEAGAAIREVVDETPPLEELYLKLLKQELPREGGSHEVRSGARPR